MSRMHLTITRAPASGILITRAVKGKIVGRAFLYVLWNKLHDRPFGFMEDVFVEPEHRGGSVGTALVQRVISEARRRGCYKLVATSRHEREKVHALYLKLGFKDQGKEFRIDFKTR
ncbi:MAG TPA: GNAT family N-acetyltransferase [Candidatus Binatia bacterium]|nr:GNAT family N-acetyltransferase [Candidatus Binatia bacterium]